MQLLLLALVTLSLSSVLHVSSTLNPNRASSNVTLPNYATTRHPLGDPRIRCNGHIFRRGVGEQSCISALEQMDDDEEYLSFGIRGGPVHFQVDLPRRWISGMYRILSGSRNQQICSQRAM